MCVLGTGSSVKKKKPSPHHFISRHKDQINKFKVFKVLADGWMKAGRENNSTIVSITSPVKSFDLKLCAYIIVIKIRTKRLRERKALAVECTKNKLNFFFKSYS